MNTSTFKVTSYRIIDLDSLELSIILLDLGYVIKAEGVSFRMWGLDAPEKNNKALTVKLNKWMQQKLSEGLQNDEIRITMIGKDKYGRLLGELFIGNVNINKLILEMGYGKPYNGGSKAGLWTDEDIKNLENKLNI